MVKIPFSKKAAFRGGIVAFAAAVGTTFSAHVSAMREYGEYEQRVRDSQTNKPTDGYAAYAGTTERIQTTFRLAEQHPESRVLISGGNPQYGLNDIIEEFETSVTPDRITFLTYAQNTKGNALETLTWARTLKLDSVTVVTDASHAPRAYLETDAVLPDNISLHFHVVGEFPEEGSLDRMKEAYKLWCVARPLCENMMRDKNPMRKVVPLPRARPQRESENADIVAANYG
jgi:uncharacterized SAM-binding protein YcdF (DUF218 family)